MNAEMTLRIRSPLEQLQLGMGTNIRIFEYSNTILLFECHFAIRTFVKKTKNKKKTF